MIFNSENSGVTGDDIMFESLIFSFSTLNHNMFDVETSQIYAIVKYLKSQ